MVTNDKERKDKPENTKITSVPVRTEEKTKTAKLGTPAIVGLAVVGGLLLLLGGTAAGFVASRTLGHDSRGGRLGVMGMHSNGDNDFGARGMPIGIRREMMRGGAHGKVTSISSDNITLTDDHSGGSITFKIDSNTDVNDSNGDNANVSDIKVGDAVSVRPTSATDDTTADTIVINPAQQQ